MKTWTKQYLNDFCRALNEIKPEEMTGLIDVFRKAWTEDRQIFVCGNGGSATNASHFVTDLGKGSSDKLSKRFRCMSLNDNVSWMTAIANDYDYSEVFVKQLENYGRPSDLLMILSVSGNSPNVVKAVEWANSKGLTTIALVGAKVGRAGAIAQKKIVVQSEHYGYVEDAQMMICHMLCYAFMENPEYAQ